MFRSWSDNSSSSSSGAGIDAPTQTPLAPAPGNASSLPSPFIPPRSNLLAGKSAPRQGAQQQPQALAKSSTAVASSCLSALPPRDPLSTRRQLPRTPLSSKNANSRNKPAGSSRARSATTTPATKIPRSSHILRSTSPSRTPGRKTAPVERTTTVGYDAAAAREKSRNGGFPTPNVGKALEASKGISTPEIKQVEEEMLNALSKTPKLSRTPPKGIVVGVGTAVGGGLSSNYSAQGAANVLEAPEMSTPEIIRQAEEQMLASFARTPKVARTPPDGAPRLPANPLSTELRAGKSNAKPPSAVLEAIEGVPVEPANPEQQQAEPTSLGLAVVPLGVPVARKAPAVEMRQMPAEVFGRSNVTQTSGPQQNDRSNHPPNFSRPALPGKPPAKHTFGRSTKLARTPPQSDRRKAGVNGEELLARGQSAVAAAGEQGWVTGAPLVEYNGKGRQQQQSIPPLPSLASSAMATQDGERLKQQQGHAFVANGTPGQWTSSPSSMDSSIINVADVRSLVGSAAKGDGGFGKGGGGFSRGALTPAAFKGLASAMRTPATAVKMRSTPVDQVRMQTR